MDDTMMVNNFECVSEDENDIEYDDNNDIEPIDVQQLTEYKMESIYEISYYITMGLINACMIYIMFNL
jgi:hypothetical protein